MKSTVEVEIAAPLDEVSRLLADPRHSAEWMHDLARYELVSGEPGAVGSTYRLVPKDGKLIFLATVQERGPAGELRLHLHSPSVDVAITATLAAIAPDHTRLVSEEVFTFRGVLSLLVLLAAGPIRASHRRHMEDFKKWVEERRRQVR